MGRMANTWHLTKISWSLLKKDRELLWLPVLSMISIAGLILVGFGVLTVTGTLGVLDGSESPDGSLIVLGIVFVFACSATAVFFEGALVAGAYDRMTGGDPTVRSAISAATTRLPALFGWALIAATVGMLLRALEERLPWLARIALWFAEAAWAVATYLVVPAIVIDDERAFASIKKSAGLVRQTWGENLISQAAFGLLGLVLALPAIVAGAIVGAVLGDTLGIVVGTGIGLAGVLAVGVVVAALSLYFKTALYVYATGGQVLGGFDEQHIRNSFRVK